MDHDPTPAPETAPTPSGPPTTTPAGSPPDIGGDSASGAGPSAGTGAGTGVDQARGGSSRRRVSGANGASPTAGTDNPDSDVNSASGTGFAPTLGTVRLASPGSVVASIPHLFGFHPENSLVILGIGHSSGDGRYIRHGVRIDLDQIRGRERAAALELAGRLRDHGADIAILVAFGPRGATGAAARPDHCRKLMAAFRAQIEAAPTEERVTVVDALYTCNGRWWSYMCRNTRCCPTTGTVVPAEAPPALTTALTTRGHTVYPSREALDATLAPYPPHILARTAAAAEPLDPTWYDTDPGLTAARHLMDALLLRCGDPTPSATSIETTASPTASTFTSAARTTRRGLATTATLPDACATAGPAAKRGSRASAAESRRSAGRSITAVVAAAAATPTAPDAGASNAATNGSSSDSAPPRRYRSSAAEPARSARGNLSATVASAATTAVSDACAATTTDSTGPRRSRASAAEPARSARGNLSATVAAAATTAESDACAAATTAPDACAAATAAPDTRATATADSTGLRRSRVSAAESPRSARRRVTAAVASRTAPGRHSSQADSPGDGPSAPVSSAARRPRATAAESPRHTAATTASLDTGAIPAARSSRRRSHVPSTDSIADPTLHPDVPQISDAEAAQLLIALLNWRARDYLACAAVTEESAVRLLRLCTELARRAPHPELRLAPYSLAAWAAWAIGRPSIAQCAVDRALAIDPDYKFASLIRAGLHHAIDGEGVRESAASTRRDLFGEAPVDPDPTDPDHASTPVPSQRSTEPVPTDTNLEMP